MYRKNRDHTPAELLNKPETVYPKISYLYELKNKLLFFKDTVQAYCKHYKKQRKESTYLAAASYY